MHAPSPILLLIFSGISLAAQAKTPGAGDALSEAESRMSKALSAFDSILNQEFSVSREVPGELEDPTQSPRIVSMDPYVVTVDKLPQFRHPHEDPVQKFFRTGKIAEHVGRTVTTTLWIKGDKGIMLSFSW